MHQSDRAVIDHFNERAATYAVAASWVNDQNSLGPLGAIVDRVQPQSILELGSGTGAVSAFLDTTGRRVALYVALDLSMAMLRRQSNARRVQADAADLPLRNGSIELVVARQVWHYLQQPGRILDEAHRVLVENGRFAVAQILPFDLADDVRWWREALLLRQPLRASSPTEHSLEQDFARAGFRVESSASVERRTSLRSWLNRYPLDGARRARLVEHFRCAPAVVRQRRQFEGAGDDLEYTIRWYIMTAVADGKV